jgi:hypothetical protein
MTAAIQARRMHAAIDDEGVIKQVLIHEYLPEIRLPDGWRSSPVMVISIAEYMRLKAAATRKGKR